jgi:hypothetical protein
MIAIGLAKRFYLPTNDHEKAWRIAPWGDLTSARGRIRAFRVACLKLFGYTA